MFDENECRLQRAYLWITLRYSIELRYQIYAEEMAATSSAGVTPEVNMWHIASATLVFKSRGDITRSKKTGVSMAATKSDLLQGYKLTHIIFTPVAVTPSSIPHSMVQGINKETPFPEDTDMSELHIPSFMIRTHLPIG